MADTRKSENNKSSRDNAAKDAQRNASVGYAAGSEGFSGDEDQTSPVTSADQIAKESLEQHKDQEGSPSEQIRGQARPKARPGQ